MKQMAMRTKLMVMVGTALVAVLALSGVAWAATTLAVTKTVPSSGATGVARTVNVKAYFNHDIKASTVTSTTFKIKKQGTTTWLGTTRSVNNTISPTSANGGSQSVVTLNPDANLASNTTYQVLIVGGSSGVKDLNGNTLGTNKSWTFTTVAPPNTTITSGPEGTVASTEASFSFSSSKAASTFECSLDGSPFAGCTSPESYSDLSQGGHTFRVRAKDASGLTDPTPASRSWTVDTGTVDTAAPNTTIDTKPANPSNDASPSFTFSGTDDVTPSANLTFECSLDDPANSAFANCTSPKSYSNLSQGPHTFFVRAKDAAEQVDDSPASYAWTVDTTAPTIINVSHVSPPDPAPANVTTNVTAAFSEAMNSSSISDQTFTLKEQGSLSNLGATVSYDPSTKKATLDPSTDLTPSTTYTATITKGVKDSAGNALAQEKTWSFTTAGPGITFTPNPLSFTSDVVCSPEIKRLTVNNNGSGNVTFASVSITGPDAARFSTGSQQYLANNGPFTVSAGTFIQDEVAFIPLGGPPQPRTYSATLTYKDGSGATIGSSVTLSARTDCLVFG